LKLLSILHLQAGKAHCQIDAAGLTLLGRDPTLEHLHPRDQGAARFTPEIRIKTKIYSAFAELNSRSSEIFRHIVEIYLETGEPVGSRNVSRHLPTALSPASVRNVMSDLEMLGLIQAPHTSAGRMPTDLGLRFFVDAMLEIGGLSNEEQAEIAVQVQRAGLANGELPNNDDILAEASSLLSGLSHGAGVVLASKVNRVLRHIEFVRLEASRALAILVGEDGSVENRVIALPAGLPSSALVEASNYLNAHIKGKTISEVVAFLEEMKQRQKTDLDELTHKVVEAGLASWAKDEEGRPKTLIVRGRANLLDDVSAIADIERIQVLFDDLEKKADIIQLLDLADDAEGVRIFIGSENKLFSLSGSSLVLSPYRDEAQNIVGVLGVIGPTRLNYARVVPVVDYTAKLVSRILT
jgi:heat-inducible transcriptional repressor